MAGRKRKAGERYESGRLINRPAIDKGTPEYQSRRAWAAGNGDQTLTWHVIGVLRAHEQITESQYRAACEYKRLFSLLYRKPAVAAGSLEEGRAGRSQEIPEDILNYAKSRMAPFDAIMNRLILKQGRKAKDAWDNLVVYDRTPRWMEPKIPTQSDVNDAQLFQRVIKEMEKALELKIAA